VLAESGTVPDGNYDSLPLVLEIPEFIKFEGTLYGKVNQLSVQPF